MLKSIPASPWSTKKLKIYEKFWDVIANSYAKRPVADEESYQQKLCKTREYLTSQTEVFEYGCGTGSTAINHAPFVKTILAIDVSSKMIDIAKTKAEKNLAENVCFEIGSIDTFRVDEHRYDVVMAHSILHLLKNPQAALVKSHAILKSGGVFVSSTTCMGDSMLGKIIGYVGPLFSYVGLLPFIKVFSTAALLLSIEQAGFVIEHQWRPQPSAAIFIIARKSS
jgi:ubiquinone/menaquinone biosynthesis C-methylase UbiE